VEKYFLKGDIKVTRDGKFFFFRSTKSKINGVLPQQETMQQFAMD